ncbi:MAG TPA: hypothetical protein PK239_05680 [Chitinophagales bacterium]|nr:hypothetical protein [Chitinophagales bacterium]
MILILLLAYLVLAYLVASRIGNFRKIGFWPTFLIGLFFSPIISMVFALISEKIEIIDNAEALIAEKKIERAAFREKEKLKVQTINSQTKIDQKVLSLKLMESIDLTDYLDVISSKSWSIVNDTAMNEKSLLFRQNGDLISIFNGNVKKNKWEFLESKNALLIDTGEKQGLYRLIYAENGLLIFSLYSSENKSYMLLADEIIDKTISIDEFFKKIEEKSKN